MTTPSSNVKGIDLRLLAVLINSLQGVAIKWLGGNYPALGISIPAWTTLAGALLTLLSGMYILFYGHR